MECPHCGLLNLESAQRCDCGYHFASGAVVPPEPSALNVDLGLLPKLPRMWLGFTLAGLSFATAAVEIAINPGLLKENSPVGFYLLFSVAAWFYWLWCVHRYHDIMTSVPGYRHPISPAQAVARHFIPFYNLYWVFKWPSEIATFVNWRMQSKAMDGWLPGLLVLIAMIVGRAIDGTLGLLLLFASGVYISSRMRKAFSAPPVPPSALAPPGVTPTLGLT